MRVAARNAQQRMWHVEFTGGSCGENEGVEQRRNETKLRVLYVFHAEQRTVYSQWRNAVEGVVTGKYFAAVFRCKRTQRVPRSPRPACHAAERQRMSQPTLTCAPNPSRVRLVLRAARRRTVCDDVNGTGNICFSGGQHGSVAGGEGSAAGMGSSEGMQRAKINAARETDNMDRRRQVEQRRAAAESPMSPAARRAATAAAHHAFSGNSGNRRSRRSAVRREGNVRFELRTRMRALRKPVFA